jgi:transcriptional regulator of acetoin/glycerol metabolism
LYVQTISSHREGETISRPDVAAGRDQWERQRIVEALQEHRWQRQKAARALGMDRTTLWRKIKKYDIAP